MVGHHGGAVVGSILMAYIYVRSARFPSDKMLKKIHFYCGRQTRRIRVISTGLPPVYLKEQRKKGSSCESFRKRHLRT